MPKSLSAEEKARLKEANSAYLQKDFEHAHALLSVLSVAHPGNATVQFGLIKCLIKRDERELARTVCARFLERGEDAKIREAFSNLGGVSVEVQGVAPAAVLDAAAPVRSRWIPTAVGGAVVIIAAAAWALSLSLTSPAPSPPAFDTAAVPGLPAVPAVPAVAPVAEPEPAQQEVEAAPAQPAPTPPRRDTPVRPLRTSRGNPPPFTKQVKWEDREFTAWTTSWGDYLEYRPKNVRSNPQVIVIAHGSTQDDDEALHWARSYIERARWMAVAERTGHIIVSPVFDRSRYRGYRTLEGNPAGADRFVLAIVDSYSEHERAFFLYGHSAGGQFAHRFALTHPLRLERVVVSAAGNYAFPDPEVSWPFGMRGAPNADAWLSATRLPLTIVVGARDTNPEGMGGQHQIGGNRVERAQQWVAHMRAFAARNGNPSCAFEVLVVPGAGHASAGIVNSSAQQLLPRGRYDAARRN